jgi:diguanylate cyclase (GGDEF)-like protein/PAS domain S-box-containing protein
MDGAYDVALVTLSMAIAVLASYAALDLAHRVTSNEGRWATIWLIGGALSMGTGIWSMHFVGKLALSTTAPISYDVPLTLASLALGIVISFFALYTTTRPTLSRRELLTGGMFMGLGICAMHYTGMAAMRLSPPVQYDPWLMLSSGLIAIGASTFALHLAFTLRSVTGLRGAYRRALAAVILGVAINGMHHTGMAAAQLAPGSVSQVRYGFDLNGEALAYLVGFAMLGVLLATLVASIVDARLAGRTARMLREVESANHGLKREIEERERTQAALRESQEQFRAAFEHAPIGMVLSDANGEWLRVNPALCRMLGFSEAELMARGYRGAVYPEDYKLGARAIRDAAATGKTAFQVEVRYLHHSGKPVPTRVSVSVVLHGESDKTMYVVQIEDVSQYRLQHERIVRLNRMHALLSGVGSLIVRTRVRGELFAQSCELAVEDGKFLFAWMGTVAEDGEIVPVAHSGVEDGYLTLIAPALSASRPLGEGPATVTIRDRKTFVANDIASDPTIARWRDEALRRGYRSMVSLPLVVQDRTVACFNLYSNEPGFFDAEELKLLGELGDDVSYALEFIARGEEMAFLASYDTLTGLANRRLFLERLNDRLRGARASGRQIGVVMIDLDHFKSINDAWGQAAGDRMLVIVAERLGQFTRSTQLLARIAGDRFAIILCNVDDNSALTRTLQEEALAQVAQPMTVFGQNLRISAKAGVAMFPVDGEDAESLLRNAESALKHAKRSSERLYYYTRQLSAAVRERMEMENRLRHAIARNEFSLHYQPKLELPSGRTVGVEALIRWNSPDMGMVPPQQFVPLLEETGLIREVGWWIIDEALRTSREWRLLRGEATPRIAVNVSSLQLQRPDFVGRMRERLEAFGDMPHGLDMEVTESLLLGGVDPTILRLQELRALGVQVAIDDFGTGYSSLTYLARLPIDALKIDRSFIVSMSESEANVSLVQTIISMAHSLGLKVVAEGVDSIEQLRLLRRMKCDQVQGFLFSRPVPFARLDTVVESLRLPAIGPASADEALRLHHLRP